MKTKIATLIGAALISTSALVNAQTANTANTANTAHDQEFHTMFMAMDTNKDGIISRAEHAAYHNSRYDTWDSPKRAR